MDPNVTEAVRLARLRGCIYVVLVLYDPELGDKVLVMEWLRSNWHELLDRAGVDGQLLATVYPDGSIETYLDGNMEIRKE